MKSATSNKGSASRRDLNPCWPVLTRYDGDRLARIGMPLGGIGTGSVSLGGRGNLFDWEIMNRPAKGITPCAAITIFHRGTSVFVLRAKTAGRPAVARALEGEIPPPYDGAQGCSADFHGLPRFRRCSFHAAYPLAQVVLSDPDMPLLARMEAFNPLIPADADASGIPVAVLRFVLRNPTARKVEATVCGTLANFIGTDGRHGKPNKNVNTYCADGGLSGILFSSEGVPRNSPYWGTMALATTARLVTRKTCWTGGEWIVPTVATLRFWDELLADGRLHDEPESTQDAPVGSLAASVTVPPRGERAVTFLLSWHFPNRMTWHTARTDGAPPCDCAGSRDDPEWIGNYYTTRYADAWAVATQTARALPEIERKTVSFVSAFCASDLPHAVREAALFNASTLRTQTVFRASDGLLFGWEGCNDAEGCCWGSCTHVWNYEQTTPFLFGALARGMREVEFLHATDAGGRMDFRVGLPLGRQAGTARADGLVAADGQLGCIMKVYREWQLSGDGQWLAALWPGVRAALAFCWIRGGWDADRDGVMEGCQHNTMDVEYYGPNPQMQVWYLGALRAAEELARAAGDPAFGDTCRDLFERGRRWTDKHLFNGEYYEHVIQPLQPGQEVARGLAPNLGRIDPSRGEFQLGAGCLVDQLVGQYMAHVCGLGYLLDKGHVRTALRSVMKYNFRRDFHGHFANVRSFVMNDEQALVMASYPRGRRPDVPFPYFTEVMTGFEYAAAAHMIYEGRVADGLRCIAAVRARYDGRKRSPFDEAECGHHYARAMAAWAAVLALTGFRYSAVEKALEFNAAPGSFFWSNGYAWGTCVKRRAGKMLRVTLKVLHGSLELRRFRLAGGGVIDFEKILVLGTGRTATWTI